MAGPGSWGAHAGAGSGGGWFFSADRGLVGGAVLGRARRRTPLDQRVPPARASDRYPHEVLFVFDQAPAVETWLGSAPGVDRYGSAAG